MSSSDSVTQRLTQGWEEVKQHIREDCGLTDISFDTWIAPLTFLAYKDQTVYILIPTDNVIQQNYVEAHYIDFFKVAVSEQAGVNVSIVFLLKKDAEAFFGKQTTGEAAEASLSDFREDNAEDQDLASSVILNEKYRFDTFVVGSNNNFAYSAALAVAESPGNVYNPLFLYGGPGLGKTHLMHSVGHFISMNNPGKKILYVTSEQFTNEVIDSIRSGKQDSRVMTRFREKYRTADVLLLDDVQFIIGKESTQEEFFHTFNVLHQAGKQIVLSSDRPPRQMETLDERFRSRFEMGLIADIQTPDYETRMAILKKLGEEYPYHIDDSAYAYVANNIKSNIRELEGAFNKLIAHYRIHNIDVMTEKDAEYVLKDFLHPSLDNIITMSKVFEAVCEHFHIQQADLVSKKRSADVVLPRHIAMYLCRRFIPNSSFEEIGNALGGRDHTTIMNGNNRIADQLQSDPELIRNVDILVKKLNPSL